MNRNLLPMTLNQKIIFLFSWCVLHGIVPFCGYIQFILSGNLWIFMICGVGLLAVCGFAYLQAIMLDLYHGSHEINLRQWLGVTAILALPSGYLGYIVYFFADGNQRGSIWWLLFACVYAVAALPPTLGQWWILSRYVRHSWLWLITWVVTFACYGLLLFAVFEYTIDSDIFVFGWIGFPVCLFISGVTMLFLINSPRMGKEKRKNEMLTPS
jgi:hypothetical protein